MEARGGHLKGSFKGTKRTASGYVAKKFSILGVSPTNVASRLTNSEVEERTNARLVVLFALALFFRWKKVASCYELSNRRVASLLTCTRVCSSRRPSAVYTHRHRHTHMRARSRKTRQPQRQHRCTAALLHNEKGGGLIKEARRGENGRRLGGIGEARADPRGLFSNKGLERGTQRTSLGRISRGKKE